MVLNEVRLASDLIHGIAQPAQMVDPLQKLEGEN